MIIQEEDYIRKDETRFQAITFKFPWYNNHKISGVFAYALILDKHNLAESLNLIIKTEVFSSIKTINPSLGTLLTRPSKDVYFSERETRCIELLTRGMTAKMIARMLNLSPRTVEHYIENLKIKLKVNSKYELIDKLISIRSKP